MKSNSENYGKIAVSIHWFSAVLIVVLLGSGFRAGFSEDVATKVDALRVHLPVAVLVMLLTIFRVIWWWRIDTKPQPLDGTPDWQRVTAHWTHMLLYLLVVLLLVSGTTMSVLSGLPDALFGAAQFPNLAELPPRTGHGIGARLIVALIFLHAGAALFHNLYLRDSTLRRIWFRKGP